MLHFFIFVVKYRGMDGTIATELLIEQQTRLGLLRPSLPRYGLDEWFHPVHTINGWLSRFGFVHLVTLDADKYNQYSSLEIRWRVR